MLAAEFSRWATRVVAEQRGYSRVLTCPVRKRGVVDGPEERIRQGLLHFLLDLQGRFRFLLDAERNRHDIELRWMHPPDFCPPTPPLLIVETKVDHVAGQSTNSQLQGYLEGACCDCGIVFTGHRMWQLNRTVSSFVQKPLAGLSDLATLIDTRSQLDPFRAQMENFILASQGDLSALKRLTTAYRHATFDLIVGGQLASYTQVHVEPDVIRCRPARQFVRNPLVFPHQLVERLVRVGP